MLRLITLAVACLALAPAAFAVDDVTTTTAAIKVNITTTVEPTSSASTTIDTTSGTVTKPGNASDIATTLAAKADEAAPEQQNADGTDEAATDTDGNQNEAELAKKFRTGPCKEACQPKIDVKSSVIESYKRHRAQVAIIGDYGSCKSTSANKYTWSVDWGDSEVHNRGLDHVGPYQSVHTYAKKGKYDVEVTFCSHTEGCDSGCTTMTKALKVKP
jgi:hypothetical protein